MNVKSFIVFPLIVVWCAFQLPFCVSCGKEVPPAAIYCPFCGTAVPATHPSLADPRDIADVGNLAGLGQRIAAFIIDSIILGLTVAAIAAASIFARFEILSLSSLSRMDFMTWRMTHPSLWIISAVIPFAYYFAMETSSGQTLGKRIVGIRVLKTNGERCDLATAAIRNTLRFIDNLFFGLIGVLLIATSAKKQRLGDVLARTVVVKR